MIVLMSDFGESEYAGMMRGVVYSLNPDARVVDLTHQVAPQSVREGAWVLLQSYKYFPKGSVFVCVVDPGVGTERDAVVVQTKDYTFVGPDNGLLYPAVHDDGVEKVFSIDVGEPESTTFHGRDVFARAGALIDMGQLERVVKGEKRDLDEALLFRLEGRTGEVVRIDRFGNIVTNIPPTGSASYVLRVAGLTRKVLWAPTYAEGPDNDLFLVTGSAGTLEIVVRNGNASFRLGVRPGERVVIE